MAETHTERFARQFHSKAFVKFVKSQPCCCCGKRAGIQAAHVKSRGAGGGWKCNIVPLCMICHADQTNRGILSFQIKNDIDLMAQARLLYQLWRKRSADF